MKRKLVVVKLGTSSLTHEDGTINLEEMKSLVDQVARAVKADHKIILVTSGAISSGTAELGIRLKPRDIVVQQVAAAVGQGILMSHYRELFRAHGLKVAQVLLTQGDLSNRNAYVHISDVLDALLELGVVPIVNENDVTSIDEIIPVMKGLRVNFSDNDVLSALVANAVEADLMVILSDVEGLYSRSPDEPGAEFIQVVEKVTPEVVAMAEGKGQLGTGGMKTKIQAAETATQSGIPVVIAHSHRPNILTDLLAGKQVGTLFRATGKISSIMRWIAYGATIRGSVTVNSGAKEAISKGASLLPVGVMKVTGTFGIGDVISLSDEHGTEFARGIANYTSEETNLTKGVQSNRIASILGYLRRKEVVLRKNLVFVEEARQ